MVGARAWTCVMKDTPVGWGGNKGSGGGVQGAVVPGG